MTGIVNCFHKIGPIMNVNHPFFLIGNITWTRNLKVAISIQLDDDLLMTEDSGSNQQIYEKQIGNFLPRRFINKS